MTATIEPIKDGLGNTLFKVSRIFPNWPSAECARLRLDGINPAGFVGALEAGPAFDSPEAPPPNCDGHSQFANTEGGEYRAALQFESATGDLDPKACTAGVCGTD